MENDELAKVLIEEGKSTNEILDFALQYAAMNLPVLPLHSINGEGSCTCGDQNCSSPGKHPRGDLVPHGLKDATTNPEIIKKWFGQGQLSLPNIGVVTGTVSGIFSLDIDGPDGEVFIFGKEIPRTPSFRTGRGRQIIFKIPKGKTIRSKTGLVSEIDIRAEGAYIVLPPSRHHTGKTYNWLISPTEVEPAPPPNWLLHMLNNKKNKSTSNNSPRGKLSAVIPDGSRDVSLASIAGRLRHFGADEEEIIEKLQKVNQDHCSPPLGEQQVEKIAKSISRYEPTEIILSPEDALKLLFEKPFDLGLQHQFFDSLAPLGIIDRKRYLNIAFETIFKKEKITLSEIKNDMNAYLKSKTLESLQNSSYLDPETNIEFLLDGQNYSMDANGLLKGDKILTHEPFFVTEILKDILEGRFFVRLVSYKNDARIEKIVANEEITNKGAIAGLSQYGFPTHIMTAGDLIFFLDDLIHRNKDRIPIGMASTQLGWIGTDVFLFPDVAISREGEKPVHFILSDPHPRMFESKGDRDVYISFIRGLKIDLPNSYTIPIFMIYAAFASFILEILLAPNLFIHIFSESGIGKTTMTNLIGSLFGNPKFTSTVWDSTEVFIGRRASVLNGIPFLIGEASSKMNSRKGEMAKIIYMLSEGKTRGKAIHDSGMATAPIREFRAVVISNGEISLLSDVDLTGSQIRLIQFETAFGIIDVNFIQKVENLISENYGLLAKEFVKKILEIDLKKYQLFKVLDPSNCSSAQKAKINHLNRLIKQLQPTYVAGCVAEELFNFGYDPKAIVGEIYEQIEIKILKNLGIVDQFLPWLHDFVFQNQDRFPNDQHFQTHSGQIWGIIKGNDLLIIKSAFDSEIMKAYSDSDGKLSKTILGELAKKEKIECDKLGNPTKNVNQKRCVVFKNFFEDLESNKDYFGE